VPGNCQFTDNGKLSYEDPLLALRHPCGGSWQKSFVKYLTDWASQPWYPNPCQNLFWNSLFERREEMARILGRLVTLGGCLLFIASFCFLPYLVVPYTSFTFTGFQLLFLGPQIPLPHYFVVENIPGVLQNNSFVWQLMVLLVLMVLFAVAGLWPNQRLAQGMAWGVIIGVGLTFLFSLCNLANNLAAGFNFMDAHANTLSGVVHGSLWTMGLLGIWLGLILAFIGSVITLRSRD